MGRINFDNIMKVFKSQTVFNGTTVASTELDLDIPRGMIVKIHDAEIQFDQVFEDFEGISVDKLAHLSAALIKDPDDSTTSLIPNNRVDHDVIMDLFGSVIIVAGTAGDVQSHYHNLRKERNFSAEGLDVFTARNMRLNVDGSGTDGGDLTESIARTTLNYTLEEITDKLIIALLDIL